MGTLVAEKVRNTGPTVLLGHAILIVMGAMFAGGCLLLLVFGAPPVLGVLGALAVLAIIGAAAHGRWQWRHTRLEIRVDRAGITVTDRKRSTEFPWPALSGVTIVHLRRKGNHMLALAPAATAGTPPSRWQRAVRFLTGRAPGETLVPVSGIDRTLVDLVKAINDGTDQFSVDHRRPLHAYIPDTSDVPSGPS